MQRCELQFSVVFIAAGLQSIPTGSKSPLRSVNQTYYLKTKSCLTFTFREEEVVTVAENLSKEGIKLLKSDQRLTAIAIVIRVKSPSVCLDGDLDHN